MKRLLYLAICLPLAWLTACDVHEFPDDFGTPSTMEDPDHGRHKLPYPF